jgi:hypothetical protein
MCLENWIYNTLYILTWLELGGDRKLANYLNNFIAFINNNG